MEPSNEMRILDQMMLQSGSPYRHISDKPEDHFALGIIAQGDRTYLIVVSLLEEAIQARGLTTEEAMRRLFPPEVVTEMEAIAHPAGEEEEQK